MRRAFQTTAPQHFLYFLPEPQGHGSLRPILGWSRVTVFVRAASSPAAEAVWFGPVKVIEVGRSEEHTSELQSLAYLVCRLLLEKKTKRNWLDGLELLVNPNGSRLRAALMLTPG